MTKTPRMRTIAECMKLLREDDPQTAMTVTALRAKVSAGEVLSVQIGKKRLINYDGLLAYLQNPVQPVGIEYGKIRRVD